MKGPTLIVVEGELMEKGPRLTKVKAKDNGGANLKWPQAKVGGALATI